MKKFQTWLFPSISFACMALVFFLPVLYLPALIIASMCFAVSLATNKSAIVPLISVFVFIGMLFVTGSIAQALIYMMLFVPIGTVLGMMYRKKGALNDMILLSLLTVGIMALLITCAYIMEVSPSFSVQDALAPFKESIKQISNDIYNAISVYANLQQNQTTFQALLAMGKEGFANSVFTSLTYQMPIILGIIAMAVTFIDYFWMKKVLSSLKMDTSFMQDFGQVRISKTGAVLYVISLLFYFMLNVTSGTTAFSLIIYIFVTILGVALSFAGLSLVYHVLQRRTGLSRWVRILIILAILVIGIFISLFFSFLALLGTLDAYYDVRKHLDGGDVL